MIAYGREPVTDAGTGTVEDPSGGFAGSTFSVTGAGRVIYVYRGNDSYLDIALFVV